MRFKKHKIKGRHKVRKPRGYIFVQYPSHPFSHTTGYVYLHRLKMENVLGRYLNKDEVVHHKDGNPRNNETSNLEVMGLSEHGHHHQGEAVAYEKCCVFCGNDFTTKHNHIKYCSKVCAGKASRKVKQPSEDELKELVWRYPRTELAVKFGVSDVSIAKWCKRLGITMPPRGYWAKKRKKVLDSEIRPTKKKLETLVCQYSLARLSEIFGVGVYVIRRWCEEYAVEKPAAGYWARQENQEGRSSSKN